MSRQIDAGTDESLRDDVIAHYEQRRARASRRGDKQQVKFLAARLRDLKGGKTIQMQFNELPEQHRQGRPWQSLFELRGNDLVPVDTEKPHGERPAEWTI